MTVYQVLISFLFYSFAGWCVEVAYHAIRVHQVINRGFLNGPVCPLYGFGVVGVFLVIQEAAGHLPTAIGEESLPLPLLFTLSILLATSLELLGGFALDKLFHARWWDYSDMRFNLHGYICLRFSLIWGTTIVLVVKVFEPYFYHFSEDILPRQAAWWMMGLCYLAYLADCIVSAGVMLKLNRELEELDQIQRSMRRLSDSLSLVVGEGAFLAQDVMSEGWQRSAALVGSSPAPPAQEPAAVLSESDEKNLIETRGDYEKKKQEVYEIYKQGVQQTKQAVGEKSEAVKQRAEVAKEKVGDTLGQLALQKDAWYRRFRSKSHLTLRRVMRFYPRFRHLKYDKLLQDIKGEWEKKHGGEEAREETLGE